MNLFAGWCVVALTLFMLSTGSSTLRSERFLVIWLLAASIGFFLAAHLGTSAKTKMRFLRCLIIAVLSIPLVTFSIAIVGSTWSSMRTIGSYEIGMTGAAVLSPLIHSLLFRVLLSIPVANAIRLGCFYYLAVIVIWIVTVVAAKKRYFEFISPSMTAGNLAIDYILLGFLIGAVLYSLSPQKAVSASGENTGRSA